MSPTYISAAVVVIAQVLSWAGIEVGSEALTTTVTTVLTIGAAAVIMYRRWAKGDVTTLGKRK